MHWYRRINIDVLLLTYAAVINTDVWWYTDIEVWWCIDIDVRYFPLEYAERQYLTLRSIAIQTYGRHLYNEPYRQ